MYKVFKYLENELLSKHLRYEWLILVLKAYKKPIHFNQYFISDMNCDIEPTCVTKMKIYFSQYLMHC